MKVILAGMGSFGTRWYNTIKSEHKDLQVVVVDTDIKRSELLKDKTDRFYTSLEEAVESEKPDFVINVTSPHMHTEINSTAFDHKLPVLCEKPIAEDYTEAIAIVKRATTENIPFMIAENYRYLTYVRKLRKLVKEKEIGDITSITIEFFRNHYEVKEYLMERMKNPLLTDVAIHHLDMVRYITGSEGKRIFARNFNPIGSRYKGNASVALLIEMENGAIVSYNGSLAAKGLETSWSGDWRIEGTNGIFTLKDDKISVEKNGDLKQIDCYDDITDGSCLDEFISALKEKRQPESSGIDYIKSQALVHFAEEADRSNKMVAINF